MDAPDEQQVNEQIDRAMEHISAGTTAVPGMTYEQGVDAALRWASGESDDLPIEDED